MASTVLLSPVALLCISPIMQSLNACMLWLTSSRVQAYDRVAPVVQDAAKTASPYVKSAITTAGDVAAPALRAVEPTLKVTCTAHMVMRLPSVHVMKPALDHRRMYAPPRDKLQSVPVPCIMRSSIVFSVPSSLYLQQFGSAMAD